MQGIFGENCILWCALAIRTLCSLFYTEIAPKLPRQSRNGGLLTDFAFLHRNQKKWDIDTAVCVCVFSPRFSILRSDN